MLPSANVQRVMREVIPVNGKIAQDAKDFVQICVSEFITQVTAEAHEKCKREDRKAITGDDILWSINQLGTSHDDLILSEHDRISPGFMHYTKVVRCFLQR
ncbi:hypothetical protein GUITHDRAFT_65525 [Guillardia theta CCMP2712]|uniref:Transcription factor CBF/NF-Y/archaeal histone domain-containing protein n=1 Tax=Guillardia theta (strain CCMP2712) TaxID=905079 RepID=L1JVM8_GUITC|nr:hypothetical protein GUITHDRAFT_65525 [Guillardia theta CCMP2712]EKX52359.1 hypothetical protein GUITHDRAFT_65525 [Guillardia theta CCMP2712]|eukprot:XP_005839339.1 hypothetical protein GUITHDRAFT_65525 [Guillardia theta CCMP2712]